MLLETAGIAPQLGDLVKDDRVTYVADLTTQTGVSLQGVVLAICGTVLGALIGIRALAAWAAEGVRGEVTVVVEGAPEPEVDLTPVELVRLVGVREQAGLTRKEAIAAVASKNGLPKREVYARALILAKKDA